MAKESVEFLIQELKNTRSPKRRSAAKKLRLLGATEAGPALFEALEREVAKGVTWETQFQMAMALGDCGYKPAIPRLRELLGHRFYGTMVYSAVAYSLVLLEREAENDPVPLLSFLNGKHHWLAVDGALIAVCLKRIKYGEHTVAQILQLIPEKNRYWATVACAGWKGHAVDAFLDQSEKSDDKWTREAAAKSRVGKYARNSVM